MLYENITVIERNPGRHMITGLLIMLAPLTVSDQFQYPSDLLIERPALEHLPEVYRKIFRISYLKVPTCMNRRRCLFTDG